MITAFRKLALSLLGILLFATPVFSQKKITDLSENEIENLVTQLAHVDLNNNPRDIITIVNAYLGIRNNQGTVNQIDVAQGRIDSSVPGDLNDQARQLFKAILDREPNNNEQTEDLLKKIRVFIAIYYKSLKDEQLKQIFSNINETLENRINKSVEYLKKQKKESKNTQAISIEIHEPSQPSTFEKAQKRSKEYAQRYPEQAKNWRGNDGWIFQGKQPDLIKVGEDIENMITAHRFLRTLTGDQHMSYVSAIKQGLLHQPAEPKNQFINQKDIDNIIAINKQDVIEYLITHKKTLAQNASDIEKEQAYQDFQEEFYYLKRKLWECSLYGFKDPRAATKFSKLQEQQNINICASSQNMQTLRVIIHLEASKHNITINEKAPNYLQAMCDIKNAFKGNELNAIWKRTPQSVKVVKQVPNDRSSFEQKISYCICEDTDSVPGRWEAYGAKLSLLTGSYKDIVPSKNKIK